MSPALIEVLALANEISNMSHVEDWKAAASFAVFLTSFLTGTFMLYDNFRARDKRKLDKSPFRTSIILSACVFYALAVFGMVRTLDSFQDIAFILANPNVQTTLSQRSLILEIPFFGVAITTAVFGIHYAIRYFKTNPEERYK